jgi:hypothetical protein
MNNLKQRIDKLMKEAHPKPRSKGVTVILSLPGEDKRQEIATLEGAGYEVINLIFDNLTMGAVT